MAMGRRKKRVRQEQLWVPTAELPVSAGHPFYERLNRLLDEKKFDEFVETLCAPFYAAKLGRPGLAPGIYFRLLMVGYFEGIDSERGIAWRASDSLSIRSFVRIALDETAPDHSTISRTRRLIDVETHQAVFQWVLTMLAERKLLKGNTIGVDSTTLEANAALRCIVRRDSGEQYDDFLRRLANESGIQTATREQLAKLDRKRPRKGSNEEWQHPHDPDARITKMKDGRTHLAHKAEHAVDMETGAIVAVTVQPADEGDTKSIVETVAEAGERIADTAAKINNEEDGEQVNPEGPAEVVTDKGYHSRAVVAELADAHVRTYCSEPNRGRQRWKEQEREQQAVYANRRRVRGRRGKRLLRERGEMLERWNEHLYDRGAMRRVHLRGRENILKRLVVHAGAANLGLLMRTIFGAGTPKALQGSLAVAFSALINLKTRIGVFGRSVIARYGAAFERMIPSAPHSRLSAAA
jgi:transposase